jgi:hypothetical protein
MQQSRRITYLALLLFVAASMFSQTANYNNSWINYNQKYYKIKIDTTGLFKLDSASLVKAGVPISTIDPQNIQLFQKGKELYPYIFGEADGVLNKNDYILFYAEKNSSKDDSLLYTFSPSAPFLTCPYYSIINDTGAVFLTWNTSTTNKRLSLNTDTTFSSYTSSPYYMREFIYPFLITAASTYYAMGPYNVVSQTDPRWMPGEGSVLYIDLQSGQNASFPFSASSYTAGPAANITVCFSGANNLAYVSPNQAVMVSYQGSSGTPITLGNYTFNAYQSFKYNYSVAAASLGANPSVNVSCLIANASDPDPNQINVNYVKVEYPQQFNLLGQYRENIYLPDDLNQAKSKLSISNFDNQGSQPILIDTTNRMISFLNKVNGNYTALVPNTGKTKFCFLSSWAKADSTMPIKAVNGNGLFVDYLSEISDSAFVIISHPKLINANNGQSGVAAYKQFRSSAAGGNYNTLLASIEDLYDQFAYGVERNPIAIKNFCGFLIAHANKPPSNLFLIGKGVHAMDCLTFNNGTEVAAAAICLIPSFGNPSSDNLLTAGLPGSTFFPEPAIPTGRICAQTDADVHNYLNKALLYVQQSPDSLWRKHAIHFVGGETAAEQGTFKQYTDALANTYDNSLIGGEVSSFYKTSTAPISINTNDSVNLLINQGTSLMTFFGHGDATGFDQNIDAPSAYNNSPRFPFIIANSCYTGDIFSATQITNSEQWILAPNDKGAIGYIATTSEGVAYELFAYTQQLYKEFGTINYGRPYAYCIKKSIDSLMNPNHGGGYLDTLLQVTCMEMTLEGDPAIKGNTANVPDYTLSNADLIFDTKTYPADSIGIKIVMTNLGKAIQSTYSVRIRRVFPNGDTTTVYKTINAPLYKDTLIFFMYEDYTHAIGVNMFSVTLNLLGQCGETYYPNNNIGPVSLFIRGSDIEPIWPYKYAIVPNISKVTLKASTADPLAPGTNYRFQMDTSAAFLHPMLNTVVLAPGGLVTIANVPLLNQDSVVYFWRVAKDTVTAPNWNQSSFQVITGKYGWEQAQFYQFNHDAYQYVHYDSLHRRFTFVNDVKTIEVTDAMIGPPGSPFLNFTVVDFYYNNGAARVWTCAADGFNVCIFDTVSGGLIPSDLTDSLIGPPSPPAWYGIYGNCVCDGAADAVSWEFGHDPQNFCGGNPNLNWQNELVNFLNGPKVPVGTPVLAYTTKGAYGPGPCCNTLDPISTNLKKALRSIGSSKIDSLGDSTSLIIFGKKGMNPGQAHEVLSHTPPELITLIDSINTRFDNGFIASELIGPARASDTAWKSLHWRYNSLEKPSQDSIIIQLIGIDVNGVKTILADFNRDSMDVLDLGHYASGKKYPYLQLIAYEADNANHTPPQLKRWQVIFDQVPECALYPSGGFSVLTNTVNEGQNYQLRMPIKNISDFPFTDSLVINYYIQDANRNIHNLPYKLKRKPFLPDSVLYDTITVATLGYGGADFLGIDVNTPGKPKYQSEEFHFNNIAQVGFNVTKDKINPILDVTFDGTHILNGDIVSAKPTVLMSLKDENKFLALNDTGNFAVYTTAANSTVQQRLYFNHNTLQFTPAVLPNNSCKILYTPTLAQDGLYTLDVKATDRSGNVSGMLDYKIQYEVINKPMITEVLNYPNPFSTSTRFVFTVTGTEVPQTLKIRIMTISGKIVREISRAELGFIHIGRNITEYAWDGTDQYGGKLANGVYFYQVVTHLNGNDVEHMNTSADEYFKKGIGKMVIMR